MKTAISVDQVWKSFRLYHERNQYLKAVALRGRRARYEEFWALRNISFEVQEGESVGLVGNNGSGKSTLLAILARIFAPTGGEAACLGPVSYLPEGFPIDEQLRVKQVIGLVAGTPGWESRWVSPLLGALDLPPGKRIRELSQGQRVQLGVALTLGRRVAEEHRGDAEDVIELRAEMGERLV